MLHPPDHICSGGWGGRGRVAAKNETIKQNMMMARTNISILIVFRSPHVIKKSKLPVIRHSGKYLFRSEAITDPIEICRQRLRPHGGGEAHKTKSPK